MMNYKFIVHDKVTKRYWLYFGEGSTTLKHHAYRYSAKELRDHPNADQLRSNDFVLLPIRD